MVVSEEINNIMGGLESGDVRLHNHRRKLTQRFDIVKKLGQGTYGKVQLGINKETGQEVAIKTIRKCKIETDADLIRIRREIQIMSSVRHPNIIHIYEVFESREKIVLVMEYAAGGELYDYLSERKVLKESEARKIFRQIATAVYYCHKNKICHRDLKLENILLDEVGNAKIADFGLSNVFNLTNLLSTFCGSPLYASPEIVKGTPYHGPEVDCWSLGVLLYTLVYGAMPFDGSNFKRLVKQISQGEYFEPKTPSPASPLISEMLTINAERRADISAICSHWWLNETCAMQCLEEAEQLASQTPVRLDILLSLSAAQPVTNGKSMVSDEQGADGTDDARPVRSHSLGSILPQVSAAPVVKEMEPPINVKVKTRKKERSQSRSGRGKVDKLKSADTSKVEDGKKLELGLVNSETRVIVKDDEDEKKVKKEGKGKVKKELRVKKGTEDVKVEGTKEEGLKIKEEGEEGVEVVKPSERRRSRVFEVAEKFNAAEALAKTPSKKVVPGILLDVTRKESEKRVDVNVKSPEKSATRTITHFPSEEFPLASTIALNKLVESAFRDEPAPFEQPKVAEKEKLPVTKDEEKVKKAVKVIGKAITEENNNKSIMLPRRKTSRAEIHLVTPQLPAENNHYTSQVEHIVNKPTVSHRTEVVIPVSAPLPPKSLNKYENESKERIIPIQMETELVKQAHSSSWPAKSATVSCRTSSSSLSRQSTADSDSGSNISLGEAIRKSPREVIIPISVEGGGYVTPNETLTRINSVTESEDESSKNDRCFTLRSTKRKPQSGNRIPRDDTAESISSDEDDNFQLLTAENLFSTLLSRVRSLTQRLNNEDKSNTSFPRLFSQHSSIFDNPPRLSETRSFSRSETAPWRRRSSTTASKDNRKSWHFCRPPVSREGNSKKTLEKGKNANNDIEDEFAAFFAKYKAPCTTNGQNTLCNGGVSNELKPLPKPPKHPADKECVINGSVKDTPKPVRKSRFLRPDFYQVPREESKYVIKNDNVRAFRERSLSRQRASTSGRSDLGWNEYGRNNTASVADKMEKWRSKYCLNRTRSDGVEEAGNLRRRLDLEIGIENGKEQPWNSLEDGKLSSDITGIAATLGRRGLNLEANGSLRSRRFSSMDISLGLGSKLEKCGSKSLTRRNERRAKLEDQIRESNDKISNRKAELERDLLATGALSVRRQDEVVLMNNKLDFENKVKKTTQLINDLTADVNKTFDKDDENVGYAKIREEKGKADEGKEPVCLEAECNITNDVKSKKANLKLNLNDKKDGKGYCGSNSKTSVLNDEEALSLLEKKHAYYRKLNELNREMDKTAHSTSSSNNGDVVTPTDDSDTWSTYSDQDWNTDLKDRIRRRSFYSRFNLYSNQPTSSTKSRYARSLSNDHKRSSSVCRFQFS